MARRREFHIQRRFKRVAIRSNQILQPYELSCRIDGLHGYKPAIFQAENRESATHGAFQNCLSLGFVDVARHLDLNLGLMRPVSRDALRRHGSACDRGCGDLGLVLTGVDGFITNMTAELCIEPCRAGVLSSTGIP